jgi:hypothetical protein
MIGLPTLVGKSRTQAFKGIKDWVCQRLQDWNMRFLSQAGKEILLKAVIQAIPTYSMSVFPLTKGLCSDINSMMKNFWWGHQENKSYVHSMSWSRMGTPKGKRGLGFRDLVCFNKTLLAKQGWRLLTSLDSITSQIIKAKYYPYSSILEANVRKKKKKKFLYMA